MARYVPKERKDELKKIDFYTYLKTYEPQELVHVAGNEYCLKSDRSVKISNGFWFDFSKEVGGKNAISYFEKVKKKKFGEILRYMDEIVGGNTAIIEESTNNSFRKVEEKILILPEKSPSNMKVRNYLASRKIDPSIIDYCIKNNLIYEDLPYHNVVFVGYDENNIAKFACVRATNSTRYMHDCKGSSKTYSFKLLSKENDTSIHLFESAIDLLSYATLIKRYGMNYQKFNLISLSGVYQPAKIIGESKVPIMLENLLKINPKIEKIIVHFDNDMAGRNATKGLQLALKNRYKVEDKPPPSCKDFNDYLCSLGEEKSKKYSGIER